MTKGKRIILTAGHNPTSQGASCDGITEHVLAVEWVGAIRHYIHTLDVQQAVTVIPSGSLSSKIATINNTGGTCCISVHFNGNIPNASGVETLHYRSSKGAELANTVHKAYAPCMRNKDRGTKLGYYRLDANRGFDAFLEQTSVPAIIIEPDFINNYRNIDYCFDHACLNIAYGLLLFCENNKQGRYARK